MTYTGSLPSTIKLYRSALTGSTGLESDVDLQILEGTGAASNCSDFAQTSSLYSNKLGSFTATSFSNGITVVNGAGSTTWTNVGPNNVVTFKITATLNASAPSTDQGKTTGTHSFVWEAQNN